MPLDGKGKIRDEEATGGSLARAFAAGAARVAPAGRRMERLQPIVDEFPCPGGKVKTAEADAIQQAPDRRGSR